jgi:nitrogen fixation-related uncharacterized protein
LDGTLSCTSPFNLHSLQYNDLDESAKRALRDTNQRRAKPAALVL